MYDSPKLFIYFSPKVLHLIRNIVSYTHDTIKQQGNTNMKEDKLEIKSFQVRMTRDLWMFLKKTSVVQETSMNEIISRCVSKYKNKINKDLTFEND